MLTPAIPAPVLLAEDEEHDVFFMQRAFTYTSVAQPLIALANGQEVISYLAGQEAYAERQHYPEPGLLLLDLNMPLVNGFEVLTWIRQHAPWRDSLPVLVLSSSGMETDKRKALELGAHEYLVKPSDFKGLLTLIADLKLRWLDPLAAGQQLTTRKP
ncbi:MAG TPA: response regulator [Candidatus Sulfotelmatobacter sp.]|nr:response regulator [Candidatus Sulfotelmatobacter sp.]HWI58269.1 response regulator [Bacillota bacterium]